MADPGAIGAGPNLGPLGRGATGNSVSKIRAGVSVGGLDILKRSLEQIAGFTDRIVANFTKWNSLGRAGGSVFGAIFGNRAGGGGGAPGNSMPHLSQHFNVPNTPQSGTASNVGTRQVIAPAGGNLMSWLASVRTPSGTGPNNPPNNGPGGGPNNPPNNPPGGGGGPGNSMPWLAGSRAGLGLMVGAQVVQAGASILSNRFARNVQESTPISAQDALTASMYRSIDYSRNEWNRIQQLGQYGGSRQDAAAAQAIALRMGQSPTQAGQFLRGVGTNVQALGGTMTAPQVAQAAGGFTSPMALRRQQAFGMPLARQGGQVRDPMSIAKDYIKLYEQRFNRGTKLNEFDFYNLQIEGAPLRLMFQNFFGLDDTSIDMVVTAGLQQVKAGGNINYNSSAQLSSLGMNRNILSLAAASYTTGGARREAQFFRSQEGAMTGRLRTEEGLQGVLAELEQGTSALTGAFHQLERVIGVVTAGMGAMGVMSMLGGGGGGGGGLGGGLGGGGGFGGLISRFTSGGVGTGPGAAPAVAGTAAPAIAGAAPAATGIMSRLGGVATSGAGRGALALAGTAAGIYGIKTAVNANNWGDMFQSAGGMAASGFAFGMMTGNPLIALGAGAAGAALGLGMSAIGMNANQGRDERERESINAANLTDLQILNSWRGSAQEGRATQLQMDAAYMTGPTGLPLSAPPGVTRQVTWANMAESGYLTGSQERGKMDRFQSRRSALISEFLQVMITQHRAAFQQYVRQRAMQDKDKPEEPQDPGPNADEDDRSDYADDMREYEEKLSKWEEDLAEKGNEYATEVAEVANAFGVFAGQPSVEDDKWAEQGHKLVDIIDLIRTDRAGRFPGQEELSTLYSEYFGDIWNPMQLKPIYTEKAIEMIERYQFGASDLAGSILEANGPLPGADIASQALTTAVTPVGSGPEGDPESGGGPATASSFTLPANTPLADAPSHSSWGGLDPRMKKRLRALFYKGKGRVGFGGGTRSEEEQRRMFLSRYRVDPNGEVEWQGKRWHKVNSGDFAAAPPGRSMHEIGMAADLTGPAVGASGWTEMVESVGLKHFASVNNEPHHVQLIEFPNSRREYEGVEDDGGEGDSATTATEHPKEQSFGGGGMGVMSGIGGFSGAMLGVNTSSLQALGGVAMGGGGGGGSTALEGTGGATTADVDPWTGGPMTGQQIAKMAYDTGFRGEGLVLAVAISKRESSWDPKAFNGNENTKDLSYGLFQINMRGDLGPSRRQEYGLERNEDLFNPKTNMRAAFKLSQSGTDFYHWGEYKGAENNYSTDMEGARSIVQGMNLGDGSFAKRGDGAYDAGNVPATSVWDTAGPTMGFGTRAGAGGAGGGLNVNVTINSVGNYAYDAKQLAAQLRPALEREYAEVSAKRSM